MKPYPKAKDRKPTNVLTISRLESIGAFIFWSIFWSLIGGATLRYDAVMSFAEFNWRLLW